MGKKQVIKLLILLLVVGGAAVAVTNLREKEMTGSLEGVGEKVLPDFPINDVREIVLKNSESQVTLRRSDDAADAWTVGERGDYEADFGKVRELLTDFWKLEVAEVIEAGPSQFGRLQLVEPGSEGAEKSKTGTLVAFKKGEDAGGETLILGKDFVAQGEASVPGMGGASPSGRYLRKADGEGLLLVSEMLASADPDPVGWLNQDFFKVEKIKSVEKSSAVTEDDWKMARDTEEGKWRLLFVRADDEVLEDAKISSVKNAFSSPRFDDVVADAKDVGEEVTTFKIETLDGFNYEITVGKELEERKHHLSVAVSATLPEERSAAEGESEEDKAKNDEEFAAEKKRLEEKLAAESALEGRVYLVPNWVVGPLLKKREELLKGNDPAPGTPGAPGAPGGLPGGLPGAGPGAGLPGGMPPFLAPPSVTPTAPPPVQNPVKPKPAATKPRATAVTDPIEINLKPKEGEGDAEKGEKKPEGDESAE